ncbi:MAG: TM2 domain-containing protein [Bacteroidia bacterium]
MKMKFVLFVLLLLSAKLTIAESNNYYIATTDGQTINIRMLEPSEDSLELVTHNYSSLNDSLQTNPTNQKRKKLINGLLSFPFPLGFLGAHRIMLGTKPWVPIVYVATFGGCFGLLPLVDFCVLMLSNNVEQYENNPNVFMWIK